MTQEHRLTVLYYFFFFSSRRRHTRFDCDWSSDVCSSDLPGGTSGEGCGTSPGGRRSTGGRHPAIAAHTIPLTAKTRSEEHTSELQSQSNLVCRLLLEKKTPHHGADVRRAHRSSALAVHHS